jgi:hypothetical protein
MLSTNNAEGQNNQNQEKFSVSNRAAHDNQYPFLHDFSQLISTMPIKNLKNDLLTEEQMQLATTLWEASRSKRQCDPNYRPQIKKLRDFYEKILIVDHKKQWDEYWKSASIHKDKSS